MRMWNVDPKMMCDKHLLGEHVEMHMFMGCIKKGKNIQGYIDKGLVNIRLIYARHQELVEEMKRRGMNHNSEMEFSLLPRGGSVDVAKNEEELKRRCSRCRELMRP